jgi:PAS domain S-box-containing protein
MYRKRLRPGVFTRITLLALSFHARHCYIAVDVPAAARPLPAAPQAYSFDNPPLGIFCRRFALITRNSMTERPVIDNQVPASAPLSIAEQHAQSDLAEKASRANEDATERARAEHALRESERRLNTLIANLPGAVYRCRADGNWTIEFLSDGYFALTGWPSSEWIGQSGHRHWELIHPEDRQNEYDRVREAIAKKCSYQVEYRLYTASGEEKWAWEQGVGIFSESGELEAIEGFTTDITDRKRVEKELRISEAKYRRLYQSMQEAFASVDMSGRIVEFNDAYCRMLGYKPEELLTLTYEDITPEQWHQFEANIIDTQILARRYSDIYEKEYRRRDGTVFPVELRTFLVTDDDDQPTSMCAIVRDITDRKAAEAALRRSHGELEQRVKERTAELERINASLRAEIRERCRVEEDLRYSEAQYKALFHQHIADRKIAEERLRAKDAELLAAAEIQAHLLPQETPQISGFDIAGRCYPAEIAAGDHFDYLGLADGSLLMVLGDVSGHGLGPAIVAADFCARLRTLSDSLSDLAEIAVRMNAGLYRETAGEIFVTAILGRLQPRSRRLTYLNAGHPPALVMNSAGEVTSRLTTGCIPFAILPEAPFVAEGSIELATGDVVLFYTDGLTEAHRRGERLFGVEGVIETMRANRNRTADEIIAALHDAACAHTAPGKIADDVTLVVIKVLPLAPAAS